MIKPRETFHFNPPSQVEEDWMLGLTDLEVYNSVFYITEENNIFELYKVPDEKAGGVSYIKVRDEIQRDLDNSDITAADLQDDVIGPFLIKEYREQVTKRIKDNLFMDILCFHIMSVIMDFESFLRRKVDLVEDHNESV